jgi:hypothetical protein
MTLGAFELGYAKICIILTEILLTLSKTKLGKGNSELALRKENAISVAVLKLLTASARAIEIIYPE